MSEALYERYKDALRRGHVAGLRGRLDVALAAYVEAATLAPERALPHASIGAVYRRMERPADALVAFDAALDRSPMDETALRGRADSLAALGRASEAAATLDQLEGVVEAAGRSVDALELASRSLELAESRARRRTVRRLADVIEGGEAPPEALLERARQLLAATERVAPAEPTVEPLPPPPDPLELSEQAAAATDAGDRETARGILLAAARRFAETGADDAALDACYQALALAPADMDCQLALTERYLERGWSAAAADKVALLARLARLAEDEGTVERARTIARERLVDEPRVADLVG